MKITVKQKLLSAGELVDKLLKSTGNSKFATFLILLIIFLVPLATPYFGFGYEGIKTNTFLCITSLLGITFLIRNIRAGLRHQFKLEKVHLALLLFLSVLTCTSFLGIDPLSSFLGRQPYLQGIITYSYLVLFAILVSVFRPKLSNISKTLAITSSLVAAAAVTGFLLTVFTNISVPLYSGRVVSTFGQPNFYAGFLLITLPFVYSLIYLRVESFWRIIGICALVLSIIGIMVSQSRSVQAILVIAIIFSVFNFIKSKWRHSFIVLTCMTVLGALYFSSLYSTGIIFEEYIEIQNSTWIFSNSPEKRVMIWPVMFELIKQRPLAGFGLDSLSIVYPKYFDQLRPELGQMSARDFALKNLHLNRTHNYLLDLLLFSGVIGLIGWIIVICLVIKLAIKSKVLLASLALYLLFIQVQNQSIVHLIQFYLIVGLAGNYRDN